MTIEKIYKDMREQSPKCLQNQIDLLYENNCDYITACIECNDEQLNTIKRAAYFYFAMITVFQEKP